VGVYEALGVGHGGLVQLSAGTAAGAESAEGSAGETGGAA